MLLKGYIDESVSKGQRVFTLSALIGEGAEWELLVVAWQAMLDDVNRRLVASSRRPISRYHASDCSTLQGEFHDWTEGDQRDITTKMLAIMERHPLKTVSYSVNLGVLGPLIPGKDLIGSAYAIATLFLIDGLGRWLAQKDRNQNPELRLTLLHERCDWGGEMLRRFKSLVEDPAFAFRRYFTSLSPVCWQACTALQPADLMAYENMKDAERRLDSRKTRYTFQEFCTNKSTGIMNRLIGEETLNSEFVGQLELPGNGGGRNTSR